MFNNSVQKLIAQLKVSDPKIYYQGEELSRIQVDSFVSRLAFIYEKIRTAIDYKEDHLIRKAAIFRILQRRLLIKVSVEDLGLALIKELIRAGYLENNLIPQSKVEEVDKLIEKYLTLFNFSIVKKGTAEGNRLFKWLMEMCACEIEELLMPPLVNRSLAEFMYKVMRPGINLGDKSLNEEEKDLQIYLAVYRALIKSDDAMINLKLLKYLYPDWKTAESKELMGLAKKINNFKSQMEKLKKYPLAQKLVRLFRKYTFVFNVLRDIILENPAEAEKIFSDPEELEYQIRSTCDRSYKKTRTKLRRSIVRVMIYIFLTKMLLALVLEFPYDYYIAKEVDLLPLAINALFPVFLMFLLGMVIRIPSRKNTDRVVSVAREVVYEGGLKEVKGGSAFGRTPKRGAFALSVFYLLYFVLFYFSFSVLIYILRRLDFNVFSMLIFLLFLSLVSFFGIKLRLKVRELVVVDKRENPLVFLINLFSLPFLKAGQWVSENFSKINVFVFILDFIIEAPFKIFLEVIEDWIAFLREKKEEMYSKE